MRDLTAISHLVLLNRQRLKFPRHTLIFALGTIVAIIALAWLPTSAPAVNVSTHSIVVDETGRSYRLVTPHELTVPVPVVFAFHGMGDSPASMAAYSQLDQMAAAHGLLLVYPAGINAMWSTFEFDAEDLDSNRDVRFFDALLARISAQYEIDRERIYLAGMSNGGSFAQLLANARSVEVAAVVACSGTRPKWLKDAERPFPILLIAGGKDLAASSMRTDLRAYQSAGHDAEFIVVDGLGHEWSCEHNNVAVKFLLSCRLEQ